MRGKQNLFLLVVIGSLIIEMLFLFYGYEKTWQLWNIPTMWPHFADLRAITGGAESYALGYDPLINNPGDPWGRLMSYPRIWQWLFLLKLNQSHTTYIGITFICLFIVGIFLFLKPINNITAWFLTISLFSPAVLLGIERANSDLLIFFIVSLALLVLSRSAFTAMILILIGFVLKLYPLFGLGCLLKENQKTFLRLAIVSLVIILIYVGLTFEDLVKIRQGTPRGIGLSYGVDVFWMSIQSHLPQVGEIFRFLSYGMVLFIFVLVLWLSRNTFPAPISEKDNHIDAFRLGSMIYLGTFMLGNNWDYRLLFLIFVIPQLVSWAINTSYYGAWIAKLTILAILISLWSLFIYRFMNLIPWGHDLTFLLEHFAKWTVFAGLFYLLVSSLPNWITGVWCVKRQL